MCDADDAYDAYDDRAREAYAADLLDRQHAVCTCGLPSTTDGHTRGCPAEDVE